MPAPAIDIDRILEAIRAEARARGSKGRVGAYSTEVPAGPGTSSGGTVVVATHGLPGYEPRRAADFLALPLDVFIGAAYRSVLGRDPDPGGAMHFQQALLSGRLTRMEMLGRLRYSPEGRARGVRVPGLAAAALLATLYRFPVAGPLLGLLAWLLRLPPHLRDRSTLEATAHASGSWMKR